MINLFFSNRKNRSNFLKNITWFNLTFKSRKSIGQKTKVKNVIKKKKNHADIPWMNKEKVIKNGDFSWEIFYWKLATSFNQQALFCSFSPKEKKKFSRKYHKNFVSKSIIDRQQLLFFFHLPVCLECLNVLIWHMMVTCFLFVSFWWKLYTISDRSISCKLFHKLIKQRNKIKQNKIKKDFLFHTYSRWVYNNEKYNNQPMNRLMFPCRM